MPAKRLVSDRQLEILIAFMEQNLHVANANPFSFADRQTLTEVWDDLTMRLNAIAESTGGCEKTHRQWRDYWNGKKYVLNKKRMIARQERRAASSNPAPVPKKLLFDEWEARMVRILTVGKCGQIRMIKPTEETLTSVIEDQNVVKETEEEIDIPYEEDNSKSASTSALLTEEVKIEMCSYSPALASSPEASSPPISPVPTPIFTTKIAAAPRHFNCRFKTPYHRSVPTAEEIKLATEDKMLAKEERRLAEKERRMAAEDRRLAAEDRRVAAEDRKLAIVERKIAVQERRLAEEARRKASDNKITKALQTMSQKLSRVSAQFDHKPP